MSQRALPRRIIRVSYHRTRRSTQLQWARCWSSPICNRRPTATATSQISLMRSSPASNHCSSLATIRSGRRSTSQPRFLAGGVTRLPSSGCNATCRWPRRRTRRNCCRCSRALLTSADNRPAVRQCPSRKNTTSSNNISIGKRASPSERRQPTSKEISMTDHEIAAAIGRPAGTRAPHWRALFAGLAGMLVLHGTAAAEPHPTRGGTLDFAVDAEPPNYDCHANFSFVFIHPVIPHYSTLLKFDTANYPQVVGDLAESWSVSTDKRTYTFKLRQNVLFHDGSRLTSADVKASYDRIIHPPQGVLSVRRADYAAITRIDTPDPATVVFHLQWPDAAMLANFASPWNCIYSAAKLKEDPLFPKTHVLGTGPFVFVEHVKGNHWTGKRWDKYFLPGKPYLDGYRAEFIAGETAVKAMESGRIMAQFRSFTPAERDEMVEMIGDRVEVREGPWTSYLALAFNANRPPFDDARVRRALSLAIDRWRGAETLADTTFLKYVGGLMRPGTAISTPEAELVTMPGFSRDIAASRAEARRLLAEAGVPDLTVTLTNRKDVPVPYGPGGDFVAAAWSE